MISDKCLWKYVLSSRAHTQTHTCNQLTSPPKKNQNISLSLSLSLSLFLSLSLSLSKPLKQNKNHQKPHPQKNNNKQTNKKKQQKIPNKQIKNHQNLKNLVSQLNFKIIST